MGGIQNIRASEVLEIKLYSIRKTVAKAVARGRGGVPTYFSSHCTEYISRKWGFNKLVTGNADFGLEFNQQ
jgi:hypothetical protein